MQSMEIHLFALINCTKLFQIEFWIIAEYIRTVEQYIHFKLFHKITDD